MTREEFLQWLKQSFVKLRITNWHSSPHDVDLVSFERKNGIAICVYHFSVYLDFTYGCDFS